MLYFMGICAFLYYVLDYSEDVDLFHAAPPSSISPSFLMGLTPPQQPILTMPQQPQLPQQPQQQAPGSANFSGGNYEYNNLTQQIQQLVQQQQQLNQSMVCSFESRHLIRCRVSCTLLRSLSHNHNRTTNKRQQFPNSNILNMHLLKTPFLQLCLCYSTNRNPNSNLLLFEIAPVQCSRVPKWHPLLHQCNSFRN